MPSSAAPLPRCFWFTGFPAAGKTTLARALHERLRALGRPSTVLDGDELRRGLCADLGLSDADRRENIRRAGEVARLMADAGLIVICAFVSPFQADRARVRALFRPGEFVEVHVDTPLATCIERDPKGLYARARAGTLQGLTGLDGLYEPPTEAEFTVDTSRESVDEIVERLCQRLSP